MEFLNNITQQTLIIAPLPWKTKILKYLNTFDNLVNIKILSMTEFLKKYDFDYDKKALVYIAQKYKTDIHTAKIYIKNMYYLTEDNKKDRKSTNLYHLKCELFEKKLIQKNTLFIENLSSWNILVYGYDYLLKQEINLIQKLKQITNIQIIPNRENSFKTLTVHKFQTLEEEVEFVCEKICHLIDKQVPCKDIKLANIKAEYYEPLKRFSKLYQIPIFLPQKIPIYETLVGKKTIKYLKEEKSFQEVLLLLEKEFPTSSIPNQILSLLNSYSFAIEKEMIPYVIEDMKTTYIKELTQKEKVEIIDIKNTPIEANQHIFLLGFNNGNFPTIHKDEDFFCDQLKKDMDHTTTEEFNKLEKEAFINKLFGISNLTLTYKLKTPFEVYYPSILIEDYNMQIIEEHPFIKTHYSRKYDRLKLTMLLDKYIQFGEKDKNLDQYYYSNSIPYKIYNHQYQTIDNNLFLKSLSSKLSLSYSSLDRFFHCKFRYYLQDILKIVKFEDTLSTKIGNVFHAVLSQHFQKKIDFDYEFEKECNQYEWTPKEKFYIEKLKPDLLFAIGQIEKQNQITGFSNASFEEKIVIENNKLLKVQLKGFIDKILWKEENGKKLITIIDYKTGTPNLNLKLALYGLNLQLPIYMYLLSKSKKFENCQMVGIYLQKILNRVPIDTKDIEQWKEKEIKLQGYSIDDEYLLEKWDPTYENSDVIKNLKKTKRGWYSYAKILNQKEIENLIQLVEEKVTEATEEILKGDFTINPKRILGNNIGCEHCKFHDICYQKEQDILDLSPVSDLSFLTNKD